MQGLTDAPRRATRRTVAVAGLAFAGLVATAVPAWAHASFPGYAAFGFAPNTSGGTGAEGSTPPYVANTAVTVYARIPYEMTEPYNGSDNTTVDVKIIVPAGWTSPACGAAKTQIKDASTNNTNQPGADVAGWSCSITTAGANQVIHWSGPQVQSPATAADSAQFFVFTITTPMPTVQTTYDGTNGTQGFIVDQTYAGGEIEHWIPNEAFPGTPPQGSQTTVAAGLARTVAAFDPSTTSTTTSTTSTTSTTLAPTTTTTATSGTAAKAVVTSPQFTG